MSRVKNPTRGPRSKAAESAAVMAELSRAEAKLPTRQAIEGSLRTIRKNLADETTDPTNPRSSAAAKLRMIERLEGKIERREYRRARTDGDA